MISWKRYLGLDSFIYLSTSTTASCISQPCGPWPHLGFCQEASTNGQGCWYGVCNTGVAKVPRFATRNNLLIAIAANGPAIYRTATRGLRAGLTAKRRTAQKAAGVTAPATNIMAVRSPNAFRSSIGLLACLRIVGTIRHHSNKRPVNFDCKPLCLALRRLPVKSFPFLPNAERGQVSAAWTLCAVGGRTERNLG